MSLARTTILVCLLGTAGCSLNKFAVNKLGDALANPGRTYASDNDPELIEGAIPFSLKLVESLLESSPRHEGLLLTAASGFTQYSVAFVQQRADFVEDQNVDSALALRARARKLDLRARDYGLRGLDVRRKGWPERLRANPRAAAAEATRGDVPLMYWTAVSWAAAIALSKENPELVADLPIVEALIDRALVLDESFGNGALHNFLITYETVRQGAKGDPNTRAREHFERAVGITHGQLASPYVSFAEAVALPQQDKTEFESLLSKAVAIDPDAMPEWRLENLIMQRRARWLMAKVPDLFLGAVPDSAAKPDTTFRR